VTLAARILLTYGLLLAIAVGGASLAAFSAHRASSELEQATLASQTPQRYLALSNHSYQLFKQFGDAVLIGDRDVNRGETELLAAIREDFDALRYDIGREIGLVGEEEIDEYVALAEIERLLDGLIDEHYAILALKKGGAPIEDLSQRLTRMHDEVIDSDFTRMIREAIAEEAREVSALHEAAARRMEILDTVAAVFLAIALIAASATVWALVRDIRGPLARLSSGADALAAGKLAHRIPPTGPAELHNLAEAFNAMAGEIERREGEVAVRNRDLEDAIARRTAELERALNALKGNEARRRELLADVSHELRTPLTIIRGEADVALRGPPKTPDAYREALERTRSTAEHTARIVDDLLFVARRDAGEAKLRLEEVELDKLLSDLVGERAHYAASAGCRLSFAGSAGEVKVRVDPLRIRQVMLILIENGICYGGDAIRVSLEHVSSTASECGWIVQSLKKQSLIAFPDHNCITFFAGSLLRANLTH
jgi:two-component system OmpR family sensor kinase